MGDAECEEQEAREKEEEAEERDGDVEEENEAPTEVYEAGNKDEAAKEVLESEEKFGRLGLGCWFVRQACRRESFNFGVVGVISDGAFSSRQGHEGDWAAKREGGGFGYGQVNFARGAE
jgi:hypothetical protein